MRATADILDEHGDAAQSCEIQLRQFGRISSFAGTVTRARRRVRAERTVSDADLQMQREVVDAFLMRTPRGARKVEAAGIDPRTIPPAS